MTADPAITKDFLRSIHLYSYEDVQEFLKINRTLDLEMQKPAEERDMDLIEECLRYIEFIMDDEKTIDDAMLETKYQEALERGKAKKPKMLGTTPKAKKHKVRKAFIILAATVTVLFTTLTIAAKVYGYKNAWEFVRQKAIELQGFDAGESVAGEGITLIGNGKVETFASFEQFLEKEKPEILYPQPLPDSLKIDTISKYSLEDGRYNYTIQFNDNNVSIITRNYYSISLESCEFLETLSINENTFYVVIREEMNCQAVCQTCGLEYTITAPDYQTLLTLLQNMKGSES